ncbi:MAG: hypothetical protein AB1627_08035 [Chloroflexota bacterium]
MIYEDEPGLARHETYLAFLSMEETPTREGSEPAWTFVWQGHGVFQSAGDGSWTNGAGKTLNDADLRTIAP